MTNTETQRLARKWVQKTNPKGDRETLAAIEQILATTDPLTMADTEWNHNEHALTGATLNHGSKTEEVVMLDKDGDDFIAYITTDTYETGYAYPQFFTPNGKRYAFYEVAPTVSPGENVADKQAEPEHPATLETLEDYENAPAGTVVAESHYFAWQKNQFGAWRKVKTRLTDREMAGTERQVLRWGWGK